jgi:tetratricopeptide (TPR) repeat protein
VAFLGGSLAVRGQYAKGLAEGERALARAQETNMLTGLAASQTCLSFIYYTGRDFVRMLEASSAIVEAAQRSGDQMYIYIGCSFRAWAESWLGDHPAALASMTQAKTVSQSLDDQLVLADWFAAAEAELALNAGRVEDALSLAEQAVAVAKPAGGILAEGLAQRIWGQALATADPPRWDESERHMAESLRALETGEAHLEAAHTHAAWARLCHDRGDGAAAREHFTHAAAQFETSGLDGELERVRSLLDEVP